MRVPKKIGLIGVHGAGKTTTTYALAGELKIDSKIVHVVEEAARVALSRGFSLDRKATIESQLWILARQMQKELEAERPKPDFILTDRTVLDSVIYTKANSPENLKVIEGIARNWIRAKPYDLLFVFKPLSSGPQDDGIRDVSKEYETQIVDAVDYVITDVIDSPFHLVGALNKRDRILECLKRIKDEFY